MKVAAAPKVAKPDHVPDELVCEVDMYNLPGGETDAQAAWVRLRDETPPIFWTPFNGGHWIATRADQIEEIQGDYERFSFENTLIPAIPRPLPAHPIDLDPPEHSKYRILIAPAFSPKAVRELGDRARRIARETIAELRPRGECEFVTEFARVLPVEVFLGMMDLPVSARDELLPLVEDVIRPGKPGAQNVARAKLAEFLEEWVAKREAEPGPDLISSLLQAEVDGEKLPRRTVLGMSVLLLSAGLDTVLSMLTYAAWALAENPEQRQLLLDQPSLLPSAVEEILRRFGLSNTGRVVTRDMEFYGVMLKKGESIQAPNCLIGLDDRRVSCPMRVDFERTETRMHGVFGKPPHVCIGATLARRELTIMLEEWIAQIPPFRVKPGTTPVQSVGMVNSFRELHLEWGPV